MYINLFTTNWVFSYFYQLILSELSIIINIDFGIKTVQYIIRIQCPRIYFNLTSIHFNKHIVEILHLFYCISLNISQSQSIYDLLCNIISQTCINVNWLYNNIFSIYIFYFHSSEFTGNNTRSLSVPILNKSQIDFLFNIDSFMN